MTHDYDFFEDDDFLCEPTGTVAQPSPQVVQNILQYARCLQNIHVGEVDIKVYLN